MQECLLPASTWREGGGEGGRGIFVEVFHRDTHPELHATSDNAGTARALHTQRIMLEM
jgi:hypothetical protein